MSIQSIGLIWITVADLQAAVKFYTETVGLKLCELNNEYGWAELCGQDGGCRLGIAQMQKEDINNVAPGDNAIATLTVENIEYSIEEMSKKGLKTLGCIVEVPQHVKMQTFVDIDGNKLQLVQLLFAKSASA